MSRLTRRTLMAMPLAASLAKAGRAAEPPVRIGVLNDQSSVFSDSTGLGSVLSAQLAAEEFTAQTGMAVEILSADHQNKPDVGSAIARDWFDRGGVNAVADLGNSAVALAVSSVAREKDRACLVSAGGTTLLTGAQCSPNTVQWTYDTYSLTTAMAQALAAEERKSWYFITVDYTFGQSLQDEASRAVQRLGGRVLGATKHPLGATDYSAFLLQAQASGADVVALANGGDDTARCAKQAHEFGLTAKQTIAGLSMLITDAHAIGLEDSQGLLVSETFYWDLNDGTRNFAGRWSPRNRGREPTMMQAGVYGVVLHYLKAVHALGNADSGGAAVRKMKEMPTDDVAFGRGVIRADGRKIHDNYVFRIKAPASSKGPWDCYDLVHTVPGDVAFRPLDQGGCPLLTQMMKG
jgi:branched-chain amino acid transport system substrate-binding protein